MGQIIIPTDRKIKGPWLLDKKALEDLNDTINLIEEKINVAYILLVDRKAELDLDEYKKWNKTIDIEEAKQKVKESYSFSVSNKFALIVTKQGKKIKDNDLISLLKSDQISDYSPTDLKIYIEKGPCEFTLEISTKYDGEFESRIKISDDNYFNDINYELSKWIDRHKPSFVMQKWSNWFPFAAFPILFLLSIITPPLIKGKTDIYKNQLIIESRALLKDGLSANETTKALEIILQNETGYVPESFNPEIKTNKTIGRIWLLTAIALIILMIKPRTVIGIGKSRWKVGFYKKWSYFVLVYIPFSIIVPIIKNKIL